MIELFEQNERKADRQSSKGNQLKWENDGIWYKADCTGYEGLAEYMVSHLLEKSSLGKNEFVQYDYEQIKYKNVFYNGVKSRNFLYDDWQIITLERLFQNFFQKSLYIVFSYYIKIYKKGDDIGLNIFLIFFLFHSFHHILYISSYSLLFYAFFLFIMCVFMHFIHFFKIILA